MEFRIEVAVKVYVGARIEAKCLSRNSHATPTQLPRNSHATPTQLPRNSHAPLTQLPRNTHVQAGLQPAIYLFLFLFPPRWQPTGKRKLSINFPNRVSGATAWLSARCKTGRIALQNRPFGSAKQHVLQPQTARFAAQGRQDGMPEWLL